MVRFALIGVMFMIIGVPFYFQKVGPNSWSGFRTPGTLANPDIWYSANKTMGLDLIIAGAVLLVISLAVMIVDQKYHPLPAYRFNFIAFLAVLTAAAGHCFWTLSRL